MSTTKGGLRNNLPKGDIGLGAVFELMPFENELVLLKFKGADERVATRRWRYILGYPLL